MLPNRTLLEYPHALTRKMRGPSLRSSGSILHYLLLVWFFPNNSGGGECDPLMGGGGAPYLRNR